MMTTDSDGIGRNGMRPFWKESAGTLDGMMSMPSTEPEATEQLLELANLGGQNLKVLYRDPQGSGMSLIWSWFGPGFVLPRHSHSADCLYFVHRGELRMGKTVFGVGDGFFVPENAPYAYTAGPDGVEILEFRSASSFDMRITESLGRWEQILDVCRTNTDRWAAVEASN